MAAAKLTDTNTEVVPIPRHVACGMLDCAIGGAAGKHTMRMPLHYGAGSISLLVLTAGPHLSSSVVPTSLSMHAGMSPNTQRLTTDSLTHLSSSVLSSFWLSMHANKPPANRRVNHKKPAPPVQQRVVQLQVSVRHAVAVAVLDRRQELLRARGAGGQGSQLFCSCRRCSAVAVAVLDC